MRQSRYKVTLDSEMYGHDATKWDTEEEAHAAVTSIETNAAGLDDGVRRTVRIIYRGRVLLRKVVSK